MSFSLVRPAMTYLFLGIVLLQSTLSLGALYESVADLMRLNLQFDFIVVGGECLRYNVLNTDSNPAGTARGNRGKCNC